MAAAAAAAHAARHLHDGEKRPAAVVERTEKPIHNYCPNQEIVRKKYESNYVQIFVAFLIFLNFFVSAAEAQILPGKGSDAAQVFLVFEWFFGIAFSVELIFNMYGFWFIPFWLNPWNMFDFVIVLISLLSLALENLPGIGVLRLFRAFRVFRLFKRVPSLKMIIEGVAASMPGVANAFVVLIILMGVWSIMGVEFFGELNPEEFGTFFNGMFTMFQMMTMDSWASAIARVIIFEQEGGFGAVFFFTSYIFVAGIVMTNVVVAILLEKYLAATKGGDEDAPEGSEGGAVEECEPSGCVLKEAAEDEMEMLLTSESSVEELERINTKGLISLLTRAMTERNLQAMEREDLLALAQFLWKLDSSSLASAIVQQSGDCSGNKSNHCPEQLSSGRGDVVSSSTAGHKQVKPVPKPSVASATTSL